MDCDSHGNCATIRNVTVSNETRVYLGPDVRVTVEDGRAYTAGSNPDVARLLIAGFKGRHPDLYAADGTSLGRGQEQWW
ncbi:MAG: hypothetical protein H0T78_08835 [Longispora sp.]|nr:hypothetical protein [Longispora sp. (in: high G+C Gram-positive bacteria)]